MKPRTYYEKCFAYDKASQICRKQPKSGFSRVALHPQKLQHMKEDRESYANKHIYSAEWWAVLLGLISFSEPAFAVTASSEKTTFATWFTTPHDIGFFAFAICMLGVASLLAHIYLRDKRLWRKVETELRNENRRLQTIEGRIELLMGAQRQIVISWNDQASRPKIAGDVTFINENCSLDVCGENCSLEKTLDFTLWVIPADAVLLEKSVRLLKEKGENFLLTVRTKKDGFVSAEGRVSYGKALLRLCEIDVVRGEILRMNEELVRAKSDLASLTGFLDSISHPIWLRDAEEKLVWLNKAYLNAVGAYSLNDVQTRSLELLEKEDREEALKILREGSVFSKRVSTKIGENSRVLDILEEPTERGGVGLAVDVSELEDARVRLQKEMESHIRTLDQLSTAVAIFDHKQRLVFYNAAYQQFWRLEPQFLETSPLDGEILERLRAQGRLPEQADFRQWKNEFLAAYQISESRENWWYLPDRRTVRVVSSPNPQGGLTYLFDDVSDRMRLESQMNAFLRVQNETLDALKEGVAAFGSDGRLKYYNRAFAEMWEFMPEGLQDQPHVDDIINYCNLLVPDNDIWAGVRGAVTGLHDMRLGLSLRMERLDKKTIDCSGQPLPDGATLLTFSDVTASVTIARALTERNDALEKAARMRDEFVHHFSYQVRSPLTNVIGFTQLLNEGTAGALNSRQKEYAAHILRSSSALLAILNDILDLASIDTGAMALTIEEVDIRSVIQEAARGLEDRMSEAKMKLDVDIHDNIQFLRADAKRIRQVLFNLLSNAVSFSKAGQSIHCVARLVQGGIALEVIDQGHGIPDEVKEKIFGRFESFPMGSSHRGLGLGLSIVRALVELHGGHVELASKKGEGTCVTCYFPNDTPPQQIAAE